MDNLLGSRALPHWSYHCPEDLKTALQLLDKYKRKCKVIAGGTDMLPAIRRGGLVCKDDMRVVDITRIDELSGVEKHKNIIRIGAATRLSEIERSPIIKKYAPLLAEAVGEMASAQVRNSGTIGGNLCTASPAADTAPPLLALNATLLVNSQHAQKHVDLESYFTGPGKTILKPDEIVTEITLPAMKKDERCVWIKLGRRNVFTLSIVSVAVWIKIKNGVVKAVRIALGAVAPTPLRVHRTEEYLTGKKISSDLVENGIKLIPAEINPISDVRATASYRKDMAMVLTRRALIKCIG
jgi:carbon-monoxide dehydrogenase medium subunit